MMPNEVLIEQAPTIKHHLHFDSVPYANIGIVDVARLLDGETARATLNGSIIAKLLDRLMTALQHTLLSMSGRPESTRLSRLINRGLNRLLARIPEITKQTHECAFVTAHTLALRGGRLDEGTLLEFIGDPSPALARYLGERDKEKEPTLSAKALAKQRERAQRKAATAHKRGSIGDPTLSKFIATARDKQFWRTVKKTPIK